MIRKIAAICFTESGRYIAEKTAECLCKYGNTVTLVKKYKGATDYLRESLDSWTRREFKEQDALIFVGAVGIGVRAIAPYVRSKSEDPAVLVVDEQGRYCIPVLSGHIGGANELAELISAELNAVPVITTATDLNRKWAVDVFAEKNGLKIQDMEKAKRVSAKILSGKCISLYIDAACNRVQGRMPKEVYVCGDEGEPDVSIGISKNPLWKETLYLIPRAVVLGIGCRKGKEAEKIEERILHVLESRNIFLESVCKVSSVDLKKDETGILRNCKKYGWEFETFSAGELESVKGEFAGSEFVKQITGINNICERSAVCAGGGGAVIIEKQAGDGITIAAVQRRWGVSFE